MKSTILFFSFIVTFMYNVSIGQTLNNKQNSINNQADNNCPLMEVNIVAAENNSGLYGISYCNHGHAPAKNAYIEIEISDGLMITQSTFPLGSIDYINGKYTFYLGDIAGLACSDFFLEIPNVSNILHCTKVHIYPDAPCRVMIDDYISNNNLGGNGGGGNGDGITMMASVTDGPQAVPAASILSPTGASNLIYEDHVFLNNVPCWDSLLLILSSGNGSVNNNQNIATNNISINTSLFDKWNTTNGATQMNVDAAFALLPIDEYCYSNQDGGNTNITTNIAQNTIIDITKEKPNLNRPNDFSSMNTINNNSDASIVNGLKEETSSTISINVSPNPFTVATTIEINGINYQDIQVQILDVSGKTIKILQTEQQPITVQRDNLSQGLYFYRLIGDQKLVQTGKLVVR